MSRVLIPAGRLPGLRWLLVAIGALALAGCGLRPPSGKTLRLVVSSEPATLDPALVTDGPSIQVILHVMEGLVQWDVHNQVVPAIARSWEVSPDGRTYTFHLRDDVRFHNGRKVTAGDFEYSINRALGSRQSTVAALYLNDIVGAGEVMAGRAAKASGIRVLDERTLRLTTDAPKAYFLAKLTYPTAFAVCREAIEAGGADWCVEAEAGKPNHYIGSGPFKLAAWHHYSRVELEANPDYFEGRPALDRLEIEVVGDASIRLMKYENGEADIIDGESSDYPRLRADPDLRKEIITRESPAVFYLGLNGLKFAPFRDARVRRAFAHAIDKERIIRVILSGVGRRADGILPPGIPGFDPGLRGAGFDPAAARALLAQAGYPGGKGFPRLTLTYSPRSADLGRVCQVVVEMLKKNLGVPVGLQELEWGTFLKEADHSNLPFYQLRWWADYLDPQDFLSIMLRSGSPNNRTGYHNPEFDRLVDAADVGRDQQERLALYRQAERLVVQDQPWVPLYFGTSIYLVKPHVRGAEIGLMGILPHKRTRLLPREL